MKNARTRLAIALSLFVCIGLGVYAVYQARAYLYGPSVSIESVEKKGPLLALKGTAERIAFLSLQGKPIFTDENGRWQETVLLLPGYTIVTVAGADRFGRKTEQHFDAYRAGEKL